MSGARAALALLIRGARAALIGLILLAGAAPAQDLPRTLPLQILSLPGQDMVLTLRQADTGAAVLKRDLPGGEPRRLLVPPGRFTVEIALAGQRLVLGPLDFAVTGLARRQGHLIDLTPLGAGAPPGIRPFALCDRQDPAEVPEGFAPFPPDPDAPDLPDPRRFETRTRVCGRVFRSAGSRRPTTSRSRPPGKPGRNRSAAPGRAAPRSHRRKG